MHVTRLVIEQGERTFSLALHPRLTVVAGVGAGARAGLVAELIGGLGSTKRGVNLEVCDDRGRRLAVLRPPAGGHRVIDLSDGSDVSDEFRGPDGRLDLLGRYGIDARRAHEILHLDRNQIDTNARMDEDVTRLAELDQTELWSTAARVRITDDELRTVVSESGTRGDPELIDRIEARHQSAEQSQRFHRRLERDALRTFLASLIAAVPVAFVRPGLAIPVVAIAAAAGMLCLVFHSRAAAAERSEQKALADAGVESYLGFVVNRVNELMDDTEARRRRIAVAEDHRSASVRWTRIAGDVSVEWALAHHEAIDTAARLRRELAALAQVSSTAPDLDDETTALAQAIVTHIGRLRHVGTGNESFPLVLDDPFTDAPPSTKLTLVELLARTAGSPQIILLTDQDEVASWARLEALTGEVALVEPQLVTNPNPRSNDLAV
ncbi:MAG: hypothetical protein JWN29_2206 [Acidimicrobiales bacterium]|nr:hypothetical protein [Acidimicrobiales bacterium]